MIDTVPLHYREYGSGEPVLILHGLFGSSRNWHTVAQRLAQSRRILGIDLRNHGDSPRAEVMDYPAMSADVVRLCRTLALPPATIIGHSMGGKVAMLMALSKPARVARLVVVDIAPVSYSDRFSPLIDSMMSLPVDTIASRSEADRSLRTQIPEATLRHFLLHNLTTRDGRFCWRVNLPVIHAHVHHILSFPEPPAGVFYPGPALFLRGGLSATVQPEHHDRIHRYFPRAVIATIAAAGHWLHADQPEAFLEALLRFFEQPALPR